MEFYQKGLSLSVSTGNIQRQSDLLDALANIEWQNGGYPAGQKHAYESQRLSRVSADLFREARGLLTEALCWKSLGNYEDSISLCMRARKLLALCDLSGGELDCGVMSHQAEVHKAKSEYIEACKIYDQMLHKVSFEVDPFIYALYFFNLTEASVQMGAPKELLETNIETVKSMFITMGYSRGSILCDLLRGDLDLREGDMVVAEQLFQKCFKYSQGKDGEVMSYSLERLGNPSFWKGMDWPSTSTTVFLVHMLRSQEKLGIFKALQFLGDLLLLTEGDTETAVSLFTVALEGFTQLDVHHSRAESMLRLGDISRGHGDFLKAVEFWTLARPLFERASQPKEVAVVDERLASITQDVQEHQRNHVRLSELHISPGEVEKPDVGTRNR
jgi:tetratricopeptide (TPR) repeat protein